MQHSCSHYNAISNHSFRKRTELRTQEQSLVAKYRRNQIASGTAPAATAAQTRYLSSPAAATLQGKTHGFVLRLPPQNIAHATFMHPLQCDQQPQPQETHRTTHTGTTTCCNTHIEGTNRVRNDPSRNRRTDEVPFIAGCSHFTGKKHGFVLRLPPQNIAHATFMQPLQCDQQPQLQETHGTTNTGTTTRCKTHRRNQSRPERPQPQPLHRRGIPFIAGCSHFTRKKHTVSCSGFLPNTKPMQHSCSHANAISNHSLKKRIELRTQEQPLVAKQHRRNQSRPERPQPQPAAQTRYLSSPAAALYTEKHTVSCSGFLPNTKPMQHSCSHANAISNHSFRKRIELRTQEQPLVAKHIEGTNRVRNDPSRNRRTDEVPFIAGCSHFTRKNTRFRAPASSPKHSPCNIHAAITMRSATTASRKAWNYEHRNNHLLQNT